MSTHQHITGCTKCVLPTSYKFANINNHGECKFCQSHAPKTFLGKEQLIKDLNLQENDKLGITVSGGKDSIYMWGFLTEILGADKVIAFSYYRPGISSEVALDNIYKTQKVLGTELVVKTDDVAYTHFKRNLEILLKNPKPEAVRVLLCAGCRYGITGEMYEEGKKHGVTKFVSGASYLELAPFKEELMAERSACGDLDDGFDNIIKDYPELDYDNNLAIIERDQHYKYKSNDTLANQIEVDDSIKLYDFDDYFENVPENIEKIVTEKYDWKKTNRSWHFDCIVEDIKDVFYFGFLGYTEMDFKLSAMVRYNLLTREEALQRIEDVNNKLKAEAYDRMLEALKVHDLEHLKPEVDKFFEESKFLELPKDRA